MLWVGAEVIMYIAVALESEISALPLLAILIWGLKGWVFNILSN